ERAERHLAAQYAVTRVLAEAHGQADGIPRTLQAVCETLGWDAGLFWTPQGGELHVDAAWARPEVPAAEFQAASRAVTFERGAGLPGRVWAGGRPAWIRDVTRDAGFSRAREAAAAGLHAGFGFPVAVGEECLGVMEFFQRPVAEPDDALLETMSALGTDIGQFLKWAHAEERLRDRDERQRFLIGVGERLAASAPDYAGTVQSLAALAVPALGDWCSVYLREADGEVRRLTTTHADPGKAGLAEALSRYGHQPDGVVTQVIASGEPVLVPDITPEMLERSATDAEHARLLRELGAHSGMVVPLGARGRMLGAIVLVSGATRHYGDEDLRVAMEFAHRAALGVDNARLYAQAQEANRVKAEFLATMSHELRTPLNAMIGYTDLLEAGIPEPIAGKPLEYVRRVGVSARHLAQLIDEILTFSRVEAGRETVAVREVELEALLAEVRAMVEPLALEKGLPVEVHLPPHPVRFHTDPAKARQILINLLGNAIKFTDQGRVELRACLRGGDVVLSVCDTGIGITPENLERIFDPFWQVAQGTTREAEGTGLGLSVARRLAQLLGGSLVVRSTPESGSTFDLCLPLSGPSGASI
ncbi:MAG TPA: ATP-binding protein, partial [Longimicrobium sp.]|nr:ATP-binding protein [Longimicrobium sp.]